MTPNFDLLNEKVLSIVEANSFHIESLKKVNTSIGIFWVLFTIITTAIILKICFYIYINHFYLFLILYPVILLLIAGRQGAFLQLVHEGAHSLIASSKKINDFIGNWMCGGPIGIYMLDYRKDHGKHHNHANTSNDAPADLEKYSITDLSSGDLKKLFIKDILGISAMKRIAGIHKANTNATEGGLKRLITTFIPQIAILLLFNGSLMAYLILWAIPLFTANMVLMRVRGIAEHGMPSQLNIHPKKGTIGNLLTRTLNSNNSSTSLAVKKIEQILIGSLSINYHLEHHIIPNVPHYNLKKLYKLLNLNSIPDLQKNYEVGYFSALSQFKK